jgi:hypothetical protein
MTSVICGPEPGKRIKACAYGAAGRPVMRTMKQRVAHVLAEAKKKGTFYKCGDHYHFGDVTKESFDLETVMEGERPIMLPDGKGHTTELTLKDVKAMVRLTLEAEDREGRS